MKLSVLVLLTLGTLGSASLLEMSQALWARLLDGGFQRIGKLDPLRVPVIKVDQAEGDTSYRVILRNLEVGGLNDSRLESVYVARGKLKSNLSDSEAGYVSYNEQRDLDSVRYRFHTLIKEPKPKNTGSQFERIVQYDPALARAVEDEDFFGFDSQQQQQQQQQEELDVSQYQQSRSQQQERKQPQPQEQQPQQRKGYKSGYGDMRVAVNTTPRSPSTKRIVFTRNYNTDINIKAQPQEEQTRPCIGACKRIQTSTSRVETRRYSASIDNAKSQTRSQEQKGFERLVATEAPASSDYEIKANFGGSRFSAETSKGQQNTQFSIRRGGSSEINYSSDYKTRQFSMGSQSTEGPSIDAQAPREFSIKAGGARPGASFSTNYRNAQISVESNSGEYLGSDGQPENRFSAKAGARPIQGQIQAEAKVSSPTKFQINAQNGGSSFSANSGGQGGSQFGFNYSGNRDNSQISAKGQSGSSDESYGTTETYGQPSSYYKGSTGQPAHVHQGSKQLCSENHGYFQTELRQAPKSSFGEASISPNYEVFEPYKEPMVQLEKQAGYVDIVYASKTKQENEPKFGNLKVAPASDPRIYGYEEIIKDLRANQRYRMHNFTEGEALSRRNEASKLAGESRQIKDLLRYAKEYQEKQGYYEEGMELIYHFGQRNNASSSNDTLTRRKRQHAIDKEEEDVMHVIVRIRVPELRVKSGYALSGKVGKQQLRGNGLLVGNFVDVTADFTVELKRIDNKTMIVRASRAKLIAKHHEIKLQGMDEKGPVEAILTHGLMASEAVAAMIADDLATKALSEGNSESMIFKMYKNLPFIEKE